MNPPEVALKDTGLHTGFACSKANVNRIIFGKHQPYGLNGPRMGKKCPDTRRPYGAC